MSKWPQSKESNACSTNISTNAGTKITSLNTTAHVDFKIISAKRFAKEFKRNRYGSSMACGETLQETLGEILKEIRESFKKMDESFKKMHESFKKMHEACEEMQRSLKEMQRKSEEFIMGMQRRREGFLAEIQETSRTIKSVNGAMDEKQQRHFDRLDRLLIVSLILYIIHQFLTWSRR